MIFLVPPQDFITGAYMLSQKDVFLPRTKVCQVCARITISVSVKLCENNHIGFTSQLVAYLTDGNKLITLPEPAIQRPVQLWTGQCSVLRVYFQSHVFVYLFMWLSIC